ncbi:MAG TPA: beta-ketoacyl synthase chain length factor [Pseudoxanthomonas sp.]|nr:beta-ketoacyl synthase chain length factor [Pseudoxanthomonas sp.]
MLSASVAGIGFWTRGLPSWEAARAFVVQGILPAEAPARPSPQLLAPNERRRAPETVAVALETALAACVAAGRDPATLSSVFASTHGDLAITDYMCETLANEPRTISPTRFHNSVHNAAAGYWTIGAGAMTPATAISAYNASFAQGLLEALAQLATGDEAVLLVGYDGQATGPLSLTSHSTGLLSGALVLSRDNLPGTPHLRVMLSDAAASAAPEEGALSRLAAGNAMLPMLPLFEALARRQGRAELHAGPGKILRMEIAYD